MKIETPHGDVTAIWHRPASAPAATIVLAHGAGGTLATPQIVAVCDLLAARGLAALRFNFVYTERGRKAPDRMPKLVDCYRAVATAASGESAALFLGGRSMGGRAASHLVADETFPCSGLIFLAYPLHPAGKPESPRTEHLGRIAQPMLFVQGTRDQLATPAVLHRSLQSLPGATLVEIDKADHSFKVPGRTPSSVNEELADHIREFATA